MGMATGSAIQTPPVLPPNGDSTRFGQVQYASDLPADGTATNVDPLDGAAAPDQGLVDGVDSEYDVRFRASVVSFRITHDEYTRATAWAAIASPRPTGPSPSIVLAFTLTCSTGSPNAFAVLAAISAK
jgi:hypothetical protein